MNTSLRYSIIQEETPVSTILNFDNDGGILRSAEKCNGSGDCRKLPLSGGTMCPSYMATRNEKDTTRARANILREFLTKSDKENRFDHVEIKEVMDLCLSCKGCTSECPSGVDMAGLKAEWTYQYQKENGVPLRSKMFAYINEFNKIGSILPSFYNWTLTNSTLSYLIKKIVNVAPERSLPTISSVNLTKWYQQEYSKFKEIKNPIKTVYFFNDEFTNWNDTHVGIKAIKLLYNLGYAVRLIAHPESGRAALSKGLLERAKHLAQQNIEIFGQLINENNVLIGTEPSCILSFRDEYPRLVRPDLVDMAEKVKANSYLIEEFISNEIKSGHISKESFDQNHRKIKLHGHCHQKALSNIEDSVWALSIAENNSVEVIPSGCCGMAGSFGYEAEHYEISQQVGELVLFPAVRQSSNDTLIAASGTSCRHQIWDGAARKSFHPVEILYDSLLRKS